MAILPVLHFPDSRLRTIAKPVTEITPQMQQLIIDMFETMYEDNGVGLAATQVNFHQRIIVMDIQKPDSKPLHFINPEILEKSGEEISEEGCLSVAGIYDKVKRSAYVKVSALDQHNKPFMLEAEGLLAICIQHEIDHLNGVLFIDHLSSLKRERAIKKLEKLKRQNI